MRKYLLLLCVLLACPAFAYEEEDDMTPAEQTLHEKNPASTEDQEYSASEDPETEVDGSENERNPLGCKDVGYSFYMKTLVLKPAETGQHQTLYFIHNLAEEPVTLYQMRTTDSNRSVYLNHTIEPNQWAVLATNEKTVRFICAIPEDKKSSGEGDVVSCKQTLHLCASTKVRFGLNNRGSFWMVGNTTRNSAIQAVLHYGVIP